jgi:ParB-like chromosome segregation protein Spo0J
MEDLIDSISDFIGGVIAATLIGGGILLLAGEIRLAALRKAKMGSIPLSAFTERMT